jgi:tRNA-dihydrouridine synthase A
MLDWTDRYCRFFLRQLTRHTLLYTEMITTGALLHRDPARFLDFDTAEHPLALQLGGSEPADLARCVALAETWGYDEVNLNVGCPSDRVQNGRFGACLMAEPDIVADCIAAMHEVGPLPITVKHRIGIDNNDSYDELLTFVDKVSAAGCSTFIVHARKAWLKGLSPKENREVPPLQYPMVHRLKQDFAHLEIVINGGFRTLDEVAEQFDHVDGVMIGREAYQNPWILADADSELFGSPVTQRTRQQVVEAMLPFIEEQLTAGVPLIQITRHMLGLFHGQYGGRAWRRHLSENAHLQAAGVDTLRDALALTIPRNRT